MPLPIGKRRLNQIFAAIWLLAFLYVAAPLARTQPNPVPSADPEKLKAELTDLRKDIEAAKNDLARVQQLLLFLAGLGAVYGLVQGTLAFRNMEAIEKRSQEDSKRHREWIEAEKKDLETQIPAFQGLEARLRIAEEQLTRVQSKVGIYRTRFRDIQEQDRAGIEFMESFLPVFEVFRGRRSESLPRLYLGMSVYFLVKAREGRIWGSQLPGAQGLSKGAAVAIDETSPERVDQFEFERCITKSRFYLDRASELGPHEYLVQNERASRLLHDGDDGALTGNPLILSQRLILARDLLQQSLKAFPDQQRALSMLAFIEDELGRLPQAASLYEKALKLSVWEQPEQPPTASQREILHYNYACCLAKQISATPDPAEKEALAKASVSHMEKCFSLSPAKLDYLRKDMEPGCDLDPIRECPSPWRQLTLLLLKLENSVSASPQNPI